VWVRFQRFELARRESENPIKEGTLSDGTRIEQWKYAVIALMKMVPDQSLHLPQLGAGVVMNNHNHQFCRRRLSFSSPPFPSTFPVLLTCARHEHTHAFKSTSDPGPHRSVEQGGPRFS